MHHFHELLAHGFEPAPRQPRSWSISNVCFGVLLSAVVLQPPAARAAAADGELLRMEFQVNDDLGRALPCRIHVRDSADKPQQAMGLPFWKNHFVCGGRAALQLLPGQYRYEIERGPEWQRASGTVDLQAGRDQPVKVQLSRIAELGKSGWFSGDLHVHRSIEIMELLMQAEDLHVAPVITWWQARSTWTDRELPRDPLLRFSGNRFCHVMAGEDERAGGALLYFNLDAPLPIAKATREYPSPMQFVEEARRRSQSVWIDVEKPFWWDAPVWLASGLVDSIGLANNHMCRDGMYESEAWGRPRDVQRLPPPRGTGFWSQEIYYHVLNCGLRLPPSAGSASGVRSHSIGYNRVYVHIDGDLTHQKWWRGLKAGQSFVTNGPLLLCTANGQLPGHVFRGDQGRPIDVTLDLTLISNDRVPSIEIVKDGRIEGVVELDDAATQRRTATVSFGESGWFLVRAIADNNETFRFASTAPFYVEIGQQKRKISRRSAQFFLDWVNERIGRIQRAVNSPDERQEILVYHEKARLFWQEQVLKAGSD